MIVKIAVVVYKSLQFDKVFDKKKIIFLIKFLIIFYKKKLKFFRYAHFKLTNCSSSK